MAIASGATLALVLAGTAAVAAHPGNDRDRGFGPSAGQAQRGIGPGMLGERGGMLGGGMLRGGMLRGGMWGDLGDLERRELTLQTSDGVTAERVEQGIVESTTDSGLTFTLASGEVVNVAIDDDTAAIAFTEQEMTTRRGFSVTRMVPSEIELTDIAAGSEVVVWSSSDDGTTFVAERITVQPIVADDATADEPLGDSSDAAADDAAAAPVADA